MHRSIRLLLAVLWFSWTAVLIPGHTRGAIPVAGSSAGSCCSHERSSDDSKPTPNRNTGNCAVCQIAAHLMPAISLPVQLDPVDLVELLPSHPLAVPNLSERSFCFQSRGPPSA
jgi:hypothetical protein